jgi:hypothetical protein
MCEADRGSGLLTTFLEQNDAPCPVCSYSLRRLTSDKCPECGATVELRVGSVDLKLAWWIALLLALAIPFGFAVILVGFTGAHAALIFWYGDRELIELWIRQMWPFIVLSGLSGPLLVAAIRRRRRFWRLRRSRQRLWFCCTVVLMVLSLGACFWWTV